MLRKHSRAARLGLGLFVLIIGCSDAPVAAPFAGGSSLSISPKLLNHDALGETTKMNVSAGRKSLSSSSVTWTSLDPTVATVSSSGEVTSRSNGETRIVVSAGESSDTAVLRVSQKVAIVIVRPGNGGAVAKMNALGDTLRLTAIAQDKLGNEMTDAVTTFESLDPGIVQVSQNGMLSSKDNGSGQAVGKSGEATDTVDVVVEQEPVTGMGLVPSSVEFTYLGETATMTVDGYDKNGRPIRSNGVQWSTDDKSVAVVDKNGIVTAMGHGTTVLHAKSGSYTASATLTVNQRLDRVAIEPTSAAVYIGQELSLQANAYDAGGNVITDASMLWSSTAPGVATVDDGRVKGLSTGGTTILATIQGRSATASVSVSQAVVGDISLSMLSATLLPGQSIQLTATVDDGNGNELTDRQVTWSSSDANIATVSAGLVTGVGAGSATITATSEDKSTTAAITVVVPVASVVVSPDRTSLEVGQTQQFQAAVLDSNDQELTDRTVTWTSSAPAVATVSSTGLVTAVAEGHATIQAYSEGRSGSASVSVTQPEAASVSITQSVDTLDALGAKSQFSALARDANSDPLPGRDDRVEEPQPRYRNSQWKRRSDSQGSRHRPHRRSNYLLPACGHCRCSRMAAADIGVRDSVQGNLKKGESLALKASGVRPRGCPDSGRACDLDIVQYQGGDRHLNRHSKRRRGRVYKYHCREFQRVRQRRDQCEHHGHCPGTGGRGVRGRLLEWRPVEEYGWVEVDRQQQDAGQHPDRTFRFA
jgi:trimeric autotransporter adhesin